MQNQKMKRARRNQFLSYSRFRRTERGRQYTSVFLFSFYARRFSLWRARPHFNVISVFPSINLSIPRRRGSANVGSSTSHIQQRSLFMQPVRCKGRDEVRVGCILNDIHPCLCCRVPATLISVVKANPDLFHISRYCSLL